MIDYTYSISTLSYNTFPYPGEPNAPVPNYYFYIELRDPETQLMVNFTTVAIGTEKLTLPEFLSDQKRRETFANELKGLVEMFDVDYTGVASRFD